MSTQLIYAILATNLVSTITMFGIIWFVQIVHYPLFGAIGKEHFCSYEKKHQQLTTFVVAPPMLLELASSISLVLVEFKCMETWIPIAGLSLTIAIWLSTFLIQVPLHAKLGDRFEERHHSRLVNSNWIRTVMWSLRVPLAVWMLIQFSTNN